MRIYIYFDLEELRARCAENNQRSNEIKVVLESDKVMQ